MKDIRSRFPKKNWIPRDAFILEKKNKTQQQVIFELTETTSTYIFTDYIIWLNYENKKINRM